MTDEEPGKAENAKAAKRAAWEGYHQYREDMKERSLLRKGQGLSPRTLIIIGVCVAAALFLRDAVPTIRDWIGWQ